MDFGGTVRVRRKAKGLRQHKLGRIVGVSQAKISRIENGHPLSWELAQQIAALLDIDLNDFKPARGRREQAGSLSLCAVLHLGAAMNIDLNAFKLANAADGAAEASAA